MRCCGVPARRIPAEAVHRWVTQLAREADCWRMPSYQVISQIVANERLLPWL